MTLETEKSAGGLTGLKVVSFESRMTKEMYTLIVRQGGQPLIIPALREVPVAENKPALAFGRRWLAGEFDILVCLTGVGIRHLVELLETEHPREAILDGFRRVKVVVRGPKPVHVLGTLGLKADVVAPEPNTWREVLAELDAKLPVTGKQVAVLEYGEPSQPLYDGLAARKAVVTRVPVYRWALPEDLLPLKAAVRELCEGRIDVALFTSAAQASHVMKVAQADGKGRALRAGLAACAVGSVGPSTTAELRELGLEADFEPEHPKMGHLVLAAAERASGILATKKTVRVETAGRKATQPADRLQDSVFLKACRREPVPYTPIWLMRQAGRYMKEYRLLRESVPFLDLCRRPELAAEVTVAAVERIGVDAAILFSDLLVVCEPMGFPVAYTKGDGPVIAEPIRTPADVDRLRDLDLAGVAYVMEGVRQSRAALPGNIPLIGFAGAPFTLASYLIEGGSSRHFALTKAFMYNHPEAWNALLSRLAASIARYLSAQAAAGAQALQVFDSWVGCLAPADYRRFVQPHVKTLFAGLPVGVPSIHFGTGTATLLPLMKEAGGTVIGIDWHTDLRQAWDQLGPETSVMGNLDPAVLFADPAAIRVEAKRVLDGAAGRPGHIFNLGHGILPGTPVQHVLSLVDAVHESSAVKR
jgi:uroporphyrinogen decarboxylase